MYNHKRRIPYIEQAGQTECGLCSLAMILSYYRCEYTLSELREEWNVGRDGLNMLLIKNIAMSLGFSAQGYRAKKLNNIITPSIMHIRNNHFVVVEQIKNNRLKIIDPAKGRYTLTFKELEQEQMGLILYLEPTENVQQRKIKPIANSYFKLLKNEKKYISLIFLSTLFLQGVSILVPIGISYITDSIIEIDNYMFLFKLLTIIILIIIINGVMVSIKSYTIVKLQLNFDKKLSTAFVKKFLGLPFHFFQKIATGDIVHRYTGTIIVRELLSNRIISIWLDLGLIVIYFIYMCCTSIKLTLVITILTAIQIIVSVVNINKSKKLQCKEVSVQANATNYFTEISKAANIIKIKGAESIIFDKWSTMYMKQLNAMKSKRNFIASIQIMNQTLQFATPLFILWISLTEFYSNNISIGIMFSFFTISTNFLAPVSSIVTTINDIIYANSYFKRITDILNLNEENNLDSGKEVLLHQAHLQMKDVSFQYGVNGQFVLKNINLNIKGGEFVGLVGSSGSGKSTLGTLLLGLEKPTHGNITIEDIDLESFNKTQFRKQIGVVVQDMYLFNQTIWDNITFGNSNVTESEISDVCKISEIYSDIMEMPMKFDTILSENGTNISGGQRQRIALARALLGKPSVLLLDEATSSLDTITEKKIQKNLSALKCTKIVVAHRLSTIKDADKIIVLQDGRIVDIGKHNYLINECSYYAELYNRQQREQEKGA